MKLIVAGGGTGGHLFPGVAVAEEFLAASPANAVLFVGSSSGIEARLVPKLGHRLEVVSASGMKGVGGWRKIVSAVHLFKGFLQSLRVLVTFRPDFVLGVGGYASAPLLLAAGVLRVPVYIHEQNAYPGITNRFLSRLARRVFISMPEAARFFSSRKTVLTGNPVRKEIVGNFMAGCGSGAERFRLLVFGGSSGAHRINLSLMEALPYLDSVKDRLRIVHQTGAADLDLVREGYRQAGFDAVVTPFIDDMAGAYRSADLLVCRAGATTIAEVTACGKGCIFIPFPHAADDHQRKNAESLVASGAGLMILERDLSGETLAMQILALVDDPARLAALERKARDLALLDAAQAIVGEMIATSSVK